MPRITHQTIAEAAVAAAEAGLKVVPLIEMGKRPWLSGWQDAASDDPTEVASWFAARSGSNYGIATGHDGLFSVDLDGAEAIEWWRSHGFVGAEVRTPSGGLHVYFRAIGLDVQTNASKIHPKVDIRGTGGQCVGPGSRVPLGTYQGDIEAIANAPEAPQELIEMIPERVTWTNVAPERAEKVDEASETERRSLKSIIESLRALPEIWHEGAGWHSVVWKAAAWLARMVNSSEYATTEASALQILLDHTPTYGSEWGDDKILEQWASAQKQNVGRYAESPRDSYDDIPSLLPLFLAQEQMPDYDSSGRQFLDLTISQPQSDSLGSRWHRIRTILLESFRAGLDISHAMTFAATSVAAEPIMAEADGRLRIYREAVAQQGVAAVEHETGALTEVGEFVPQEYADDPIILLTDEERERLASGEYVWLGDRYFAWVEESVRLVNMPYHRMNWWILLSVVFGLIAYAPREGKKVGVNLAGIIVGPSGTGKTEALDKMESVLRAYWPDDDTPNIGADATTEALHDALIMRDGKPSLAISDEANKLLGEMAGGKSFRGDLVTLWTEILEGYVRPSLRSSKKEVSGKAASTSFSMLLQGVPEKMRGVLLPDFWDSGFMPRLIFVFGDQTTVTEADEDVRLVEGDVDKAYNAMPLQFAAEFREAKRKLAKFASQNADGGREPFPMKYEPDALTRLNLGRRKAVATMRAKPNGQMLGSYTRRIGNNMLKMSSLVALSEARNTVTERDVVIALGAIEEFLTAACRMAEMSVSSEFSLEVDQLEEQIAKKGGRIDAALIYRQAKRPVNETDRIIQQLVAERRAVRARTDRGDNIVQLLRAENEEEKAA